MSRSYCWTLANHTADEVGLLRTLVDRQACRYVCWGAEVCPKTNTPHLQGYVEFSAPKRLAGAKQAMGIPRMHLERRKGTREQARDYCRKGVQSHDEWTLLGTAGPNFHKDAEFTELGSWEAGGQGARTDLLSVCKLIAEGADEHKTMEEHPTVHLRFFRGIQRQIALRERKATRAFRPLETLVLFGDSGAGKTRFVHETDPDVFVVNPEDAFPFDGYDGEKSILIDDFTGQLKFRHLLKVLDGHQLRVNTKGGHRYACWTRVFITSNKAPSVWYKKGAPPELKRRITRIVQYTGDQQLPWSWPTAPKPAPTLRNVVRNEAGGNTRPPAPPAYPLPGGELDETLEELLELSISVPKTDISDDARRWAETHNGT